MFKKTTENASFTRKPGTKTNTLIGQRCMKVTVCTYDTTVLVDTMYSTSLVQGFMKLNQRLLRVMKEPSLILNL